MLEQSLRKSETVKTPNLQTKLKFSVLNRNKPLHLLELKANKTPAARVVCQPQSNWVVQYHKFVWYRGG